jgi:hypothetical protein
VIFRTFLRRYDFRLAVDIAVPFSQQLLQASFDIVPSSDQSWRCPWVGH